MVEQIIYYALTLTVALMLCFLVFIFIKNLNTCKQHGKISDAIHKYNICCIRTRLYDNMVDYSEMEHYDQTLFRLWDWGYKRILPPEKFELVKPFIERSEGK